MRALIGLLTIVLAACGSAPAASQIGTRYVDPEGTYTIQVDPGWTISVGGFAQGVEAWILGPAEGGFTPNLNLLTQGAPGMDLDAYIKRSVETATSYIPDVSILDQTTIDGPGGKLARLEYTGTVQGRSLHFLSYTAVSGGTAVIATLSTPPDTFTTWRAAAEPYMETLRQQ